ncbi:hypothetical protein HS125_05130 [bacterium]|nr:hypothetical protein [bacterium]
MISLKQFLKLASSGRAIPLVEQVRGHYWPLDLFSRISDYGRAKHCVLLESAEVVRKYGEHSLAAVDPCLYVCGRGQSFKITALNARGRRLLPMLREARCDELSLPGTRWRAGSCPRAGTCPRRSGCTCPIMPTFCAPSPSSPAPRRNRSALWRPLRHVGL